LPAPVYTLERYGPFLWDTDPAHAYYVVLPGPLSNLAWIGESPESVLRRFANTLQGFGDIYRSNYDLQLVGLLADLARLSTTALGLRPLAEVGLAGPPPDWQSIRDAVDTLQARVDFLGALVEAPPVTLELLTTEGLARVSEFAGDWGSILNVLLDTFA
jgi:hypothetical protein